MIQDIYLDWDVYLEHLEIYKNKQLYPTPVPVFIHEKCYARY